MSCDGGCEIKCGALATAKMYSAPEMVAAVKAVSGVSVGLSSSVRLEDSLALLSRQNANCVPGVLRDTDCQLRAKQIASQSSVVTWTKAKPVMGPDLGISPYTATPLGSEIVFAANIPTAEYAALLRVGQFEVSVTGILGDFTYDGPASLLAARSTWYAEQDNEVLVVSQSTGQRFGRTILTTSSNTPGGSVIAWTPFDQLAQLEFSIPGLTGVNFTDTNVVTIRFEVERTPMVLASCVFPARCGEPEWSEPEAV